MIGTIVLYAGVICWVLLITWASAAASSKTDKNEKRLWSLEDDIDKCARTHHFNFEMAENHKRLLKIEGSINALTDSYHAHGTLITDLANQINALQEHCALLREAQLKKPSQRLLKMAPIKVDLTYSAPKNLGRKKKS